MDDINFLDILLFNVNKMTLELFATMLEKCNSFEEFKSCVLATLQNLKDGKEDNNDK